jgi:hypothetical protein
VWQGLKRNHERHEPRPAPRSGRLIRPERREDFSTNDGLRRPSLDGAFVWFVDNLTKAAAPPLLSFSWFLFWGRFQECGA